MGKTRKVIIVIAFSMVECMAAAREGEAGYQEAEKAFLAEPGNVDTNYRLGQMALETGRFHEAQAAFERILFQKPEDERARLELGRAYFLSGSYTQAQKEFVAVLDAKPPKPVREKILRYLDEIDRRQSRMSLDGVVSAALQHDTNVKNAHGTDAYDVYVGEESVSVTGEKEASDTSHREFAVLRYRNDLGRKGKGFAGASLTALNQSYLSEDDVNLAYFGVEAGGGYLFGQGSLYVPVRYERLWYGGDDYLAVTGIVPTLSWGLANGTTLFAEAGFRKKGYVQDENSDRDSTLVSFSGGAAWRTMGAKVTVSATAETETKDDDDSQRVDVDMAMVGGRAAVVYPLNKMSDLYAHLAVKSYAYSDENPQFGNKRSDDYLNLNLSYSRKVGQTLMLNVAYDYISNGSNQSAYDYAKHMLTAGVAYPFQIGGR